VDLGNRFRLIVAEVDVVKPPKPLPKLPVARAVWTCRPDFKTACAAWIYAGAAHHSAFAQSLTVEHMENYAAMFGLETAVIDGDTELRQFQQDLRTNEVYYHLAPGLGRL
jgi:L-arabinose isomerase